MAATTETHAVDKHLSDILHELNSIKASCVKLVGKCNDKELQIITGRFIEVESKRSEYKFVDKQGHIPQGQAQLNDLLQECYELKEILQMEMELKSIKHDIETLPKSSSLQASPTIIEIQNRLASIDNRRVDGKFVTSRGEVPHGQAILHELLSECYQLKDSKIGA